MKILKTIEPTQLDNKINHLEQNEMNIDTLKKDHKEFIKKQMNIIQ